MTNGDHVATAMRMRALLHGHLVSRALTVVARLGIVELLTDGPLTAADLASRTGVDPASLRRLLGALAVFKVFDDLGDDRFGVTPLGATLHPECPGSTLPTALLLAGDFGEVWHDLAETVRDGGDAIQRRFGVGLFEHLQRNLELHNAFDSSQARGMELEAAEIFEYVRFDGDGTVVDIGGGDGSLLAEFLTRQPERRGVLLDVPTTADRALVTLRKAGVADRAEVVAGDFFAEWPAGGKLYVLCHVLHDWSDDQAVAILRAGRRALAGGAELAVIDLAAPTPGETGPAARAAASMDLYMMSLFGGSGGRERTVEHVERLLATAGLRVTSTARLPSGMAVVRAIANGASYEVASGSEPRIDK